MTDPPNPGDSEPFVEGGLPEDSTIPEDYGRLAAGTLPEDRYDELFSRPRGIFTDTDRKYLWGIKEEYAHKETESARRSDIRERVINAVLDMSLLRVISDKGRETIFTELADGAMEPRTAVESFIWFIYLGMDTDEEWLESTLANGISNAEEDYREGEGYHGPTNVDVEIEVGERYDTGEIYQRFKRFGADSLAPAELGVLVRAGGLDEEELASLAEGDEWPPSGMVE